MMNLRNSQGLTSNAAAELALHNEIEHYGMLTAGATADFHRLQQSKINGLNKEFSFKNYGDGGGSNYQGKDHQLNQMS